MSSAPKKPYELYRKSTLGITLQTTLTEFVDSNVITRELSQKMMEQFDKCMQEVMFAEPHMNFSFSGHLNSYRSYNNDWTLFFDDFIIDDGSRTYHTGKTKVIAVPANEIQVKKNKRASGD